MTGTYRFVPDFTEFFAVLPAGNKPDMVSISSIETLYEAVVPVALSRLRRNQAHFAGQFPSYGDGHTAYRLTANKNWLASFWAGWHWLAYAVTGDPADRAAAAAMLPSFAARLDDGVRLNHDLGFLFTLSARAQYQLAGDEAARALALRGADALLARFNEPGQHIQAWGEVGATDEAGRFIIDCLMNLPLLYWASDTTGNPRYAQVATAHAETTQRYLLRDDGSTYHTYFLDPASGAPVGPKTHQGYADDSLWARGQAWAVYGFTLAAEWTGDTAFTDCATQAADRYLAEAPLRDIAPWDLRLPADAPQYPDSSADAITAGGLLRLAGLTGSQTYRTHAANLLLMLGQQAFDTREAAQGLLLHGTQHVPAGYGIDTYTIFGDYFFLEAVLRLNGQAPDFWGPPASDYASGS